MAACERKREQARVEKPGAPGPDIAISRAGLAMRRINNHSRKRVFFFSAMEFFA